MYIVHAHMSVCVRHIGLLLTLARTSTVKLLLSVWQARTMRCGAPWGGRPSAAGAYGS